MLLECYGVIIICLRVNVKHLGGIYVPLWTFVRNLGGFENPGVDNLRSLVYARKDNKDLVGLIEHKELCLCGL